MTVNEYLEKLLEDHKLSDDEREEIQTTSDEVREKLNNEFCRKIITIKYSGSIAKHTAITESKDIDLAIHFKKTAFETLEEMYNSVFDYLQKNYAVRKQKVSIGLVDLNVDVVPGRRIDEEDESNNDVFLYKTDDGGRIKTNIETHKKHISESGCRKIIRLAKIWKIKHDLKFKSFALELLVIQALENSDKTSLSDRFKEVLEYIKENVEQVRLVDPANSNNNVADAVQPIDKTLFKMKAEIGLGYIKDAEEGQESLLSAWKKVFNDFSGDSDSERGNSSNIIIKRETADYGRQPERRHG